jgi:hypothetical protein
MVCDREKLSSVLDSATQKSITLAKIFKNVFNNCKNAGLCYKWIKKKSHHKVTVNTVETNVKN